MKKTGRNYLGLCPFHQEKTPSFTVSAEKQIFHCFGCGKGGDVVSFVMNIEQLPYMEAMQKLASRIGIVISKNSNEQAGRMSVRTKIMQINRLAADFFRKSITSNVSQEACDYLKRRKISDEVSILFQIGFTSDSWHELKNYLEKKKVISADAVSAGLLSQKNDGSTFDRFRGRIIFPIANISGDIIAFGGRVIGAGEPKYLNSPETPVYIKGNNLYGLYQAREFIAKEQHAIIVEGYLDLLSLWGHGIKNVVATLGTALTEKQVQLLRRYSQNVYIIFDGDKAGKNAMVRSWEVFVSGGIEAKVVSLPDGKDPDDFVNEYGAQGVRECVKKAKPLGDFFLDNTIGKVSNVAQMKEAISEIMPLVAGVKDDVARALMVKQIAERSGLPEHVLQVKKTPTYAMTNDALIAKTIDQEVDVLDKQEVALINIMAEYPPAIAMVVNEGVLELFSTGFLKNIGEMILDTYKVTGTVDIMSILNRLNESPMRDKLISEISKEFSCEEDDARQNTQKITAQEIIANIKKRENRDIYRKLKTLLIEADKRGDIENCNKIMREMQLIKEQEKKLG